MKVECGLRVGCGRCGIDATPGRLLELLSFAESNGGTLPRGLRAQDLRRRSCPDWAPELSADTPGTVLIDADGNECGTAAPWYDPTCPTISDCAYGLLVRDVTIEDPHELTGSRSRRARAKGCTIWNGRRMGTATIEIVGGTKPSVELIRSWLLKRLRGFSACCAQTMDVWLWCGDCDGKSGRRTLTDVGDWGLSIDADTPALTECGCVVTLEFTAGPVVEDPGASVDGAVVEVFEDVCRPICNEFATVTRDVARPKDRCLVDLTFQAATGALTYCLVNCESFDPETHYAVPRNVTRVEADGVECCPVEIRRLDLWSSPGQIVPMQESLYQALVLDKVASGDGIDCVTCPPVVRTVRVANDDYRPTCENCPPGIRGAACAEQVGLSVNSAGFVNVPASAGPHIWDVGTGTTGNAAADLWIDYLACVGALTPADVVNDCPDGSTVAVEMVIDLATGATCLHAMKPAIGGGLSTFCDSSGLCQQYALDAPGMNVPAGQTGDDIFGNACEASGLVPSNGPQPISTDLVETIACSTEEIAPNCLPYVDVPYSGAGPCVLIDVAADGTFTLTYEATGDPVPDSDDIRNASFKWAPCSPTGSDDECPPIVPDEAGLVLNSDGTADPDGWILGSGFPGEVTADQLTIVEVDGAPNVDSPVVETVTEQVRNDPGVSCDPPCGGVPRRFPQPTVTCWPCDLDDEVQMLVACVEGLNPAAEYRPTVTITAVEEMCNVSALVAPMGTPFAAPDPDCLDVYWCGRVPWDILRLEAGGRFRLAGGCATVTCGGVPQDAGAGWVAPSNGPRSGETICGTDKVWLIVLFDEKTEPPVVSFGVDCLASL